MRKSSSRGDRDRDSFSSSSDEGDDREILIHQNDRKPTLHNHNDNDHHHLPASSPPPRRSTFHISDHHDPDDLERSRFVSPRLFPGSSGGGTLNKLKLLNKRYLMAIFVFLPLLIIVAVYFPTHLSSATFSCALNYKNNNNGLSDANRMRDSELRALYLLRQQQLSLISLFNRTSSSSFYIGPPPANNSNTAATTTTTTTSTNSNSTTNYAKNNDKEYLYGVKSALLKQISLNQEIQQVLLSPHKSKSSTTTAGVNASSSDDDDGASSTTLGTPFQDMCGKLDQRLSDRRTIEWKPRSDKFLFVICLSGQMSNHLICLEKHMFFAALLNRVLVIPSSKFDYQYNRVLDIQHINQCLGRTVVLSFEEFLDANKNKNHPRIDRFFCYFSSPTPCYLDDEHAKKLKGLGMSMGKLESPWKEDVKKPTKRTVQDVEAKFASNHDVIAIGDVFYAQVEKEWVMQPGGPIAHKCKTLIEPSRLIMLTAQRFIQTFLGKNFIALHFRRHGFLKFCNAKEPSCFYPIPQAANCITRIVEKANIPVIYLSTDAAGSETGLLQSLVVLNGKTIPLVQRPSHNYAEKWDALLHRHGIADDPQVDAMLDKTICAISRVFIGASGSTFTEDILRLRKDWGTASLCDEYLCEGELPNFIAEDE